MQDGRLRVMHADGPIPLIIHHRDAIIAATAGCLLLSLVLFFVEYLLQEKPMSGPKEPVFASQV